MSIKMEIQIKAKTKHDMCICREVIASYFGGLLMRESDINNPKNWFRVSKGNWKFNETSSCFWY